MIIKDFKGRVYKLVEIDKSTTLLQDMTNYSYVRIRSYNWTDIGFLTS